MISPSLSRVVAPCPYFLHCGGCHYQHIAYESQLEQKRTILREVLRRVGKIDFDGEIDAIAGEPWQYRNRVQLHVEDGKLGYFEQGSRGLCPIERCAIASPALNQAISKLSAEPPRAKAGLELFTNETETQVNVLDRVPRPVYERVASLGIAGPIEYGGFRISPNSFFQVNRFLIDRLVECAIGGAHGGSALDLYAGVGLFAMRLAERFERVTAVESGWSAFRDLEFNIQRSSPAIAPVRADAEHYLATLEPIPDLILADPPRAGLSRTVVHELARIQSPHVTIVSCDPATLARDLAGLVAAGYRIEKVTLVDLFPQTFHMETVVHLLR